MEHQFVLALWDALILFGEQYRKLDVDSLVQSSTLSLAYVSTRTSYAGEANRGIPLPQYLER
jgi:hypothetical protein